ncbi:MSC_0621 family F1-like ATPase epsilon subunit [Mycoplasmopsis felis]|uniref:MSC_0621 family F1-like ATPase epsilon subunit n=1 Tax=Mycoplasmopsis felis TaxID=33923 RepID=UPI002AFE8ECF|nr:hypothetical protein [Mycoplasmopsis felis]WQQ09854.1 hypothetical protein RRG49_02635 [Mycoplasmopsis felis]
MSKKIIMSFLDNKVLKLKNYELYLNHNEELDWIKITDKSISAFSRMLIKLHNKEKDNTFYLFLKNLNIVDNGQEILVKSFSDIHFYKHSKHKQNYKQEIKELKKEISKLQTALYLGLSIDDIIELEEYTDLLYEYELKQLLNIKERENYE